ncbi:alpha/beta hydrolase fold family protein [Mycobacterium kansasii 732]|uniref:3-oxoadipate enol-lactonase 2 n=1 Tax=Mycobacterium pseudokansasii TaxID=2341080 RepID=A0A498QQL2_9MYCO|nr:alpha/beta fold hydrolase [Mycobacterium pseudokansasii]EUA08426.1 alpha/beta hydrolase fold family protein [Mycobacterium kansasii 732]KZS70145.1 alpha/beta hydrolase [Mycobacterium kansasii]MBY0387646.1 alpha/beta fold hydrolase [Mycobacterium pseudokansasii]VAZ91641.1 3-oxoadipate enol-lactonase 2 [Mycobacterium pseudokansasii]VAZ92602.1 3-oxoadipate enol-lactonase 2 [Mycobacterium pseudokansasii]
MNRLQRDGVTLAFRVHNPLARGVPVLLTHGFGATAAMWDPNVDALSVDRPVIVWDQRGHGSSDAPDDMDAYTEQLSVADMAAVLDAAGADRAVLGGMSLGGYLSLAFHLVHPQRVAALVLVDTGPGYRNDEARAKWNAWVQRRARQLERGDAPADVSPELTQAVHEHPEGLPRAARGVMAQKDARVITSLDSITVPTLVIVGAQDTDYLAGADYMARKIPTARKVVIDNAGHAANMDQPEAFNVAVREFLDEL